MKDQGTNETKYYLKHDDELNPVVSKKDDLSDAYIPQWNDEDQRLEESDISYDRETETLTVDAEVQFNKNVTIGTEDEEADLTINGNIYQKGEAYETHAEQLYTKKDHIILREAAETKLLDGEHSGLIVTKYDGTNDIHLCVSNDGYARVGVPDEEETHSYEFTDKDLYKKNDKYYDDKKFTIEHEFYIPNNAENVEYEETLFVESTGRCNVKVTYDITEEVFQKLLTVEDKPQDQSLLYWDDKFKEARTLEVPDDNDKALVPVLQGGRVTYREYDNGDDEVKTEAQLLFDDVRPIGSTYTQYPWQKDPMELFNTDRIESFWNRIKDYDGAFFRAEGGLAEDFKEEKEEGEVVYVLDSPLVFLNYNIDYVRRIPKGFSYQEVQLGYQNSMSVYQYIPAFYQLTKDMVHIVAIYILGNNKYRIKFENDVQIDMDGTELIYNYDIPIGTLPELLARKESWTSEIHEDFSIDTTDGNAIVSTASAASPSTAQHSVRLTPIVNGTQTISTSESGVNTLLTNRTQLMYDKNVNLGHIEGLFTKWKVETTENDNWVAYPSYENDCVLSYVNTLTPTDAQTIVSIERAGDTTTYNLRMKDGSSVNVANTYDIYTIFTLPNGNRTIQSIGRVDCVILMPLKQNTIDEDDFVWRFPDTDEYCFTTANTATPTDAQIIDKIWGRPTTNYGGVWLQYKNGNISAFAYNGANINFVDKTANTYTFCTLVNMFMTPNKALFDKDSRVEKVWLPFKDEDSYYKLSIASAASPTVAQQVKYIMPLKGNLTPAYIVVKNDNTVNVYNTAGISTTLYVNNVVWGSINAVQLQWDVEEDDDGTTRTTTYTPKQSLRTNEGYDILKVVHKYTYVGSASDTWSYFTNEDGEEVEKEYWYNSLSVYDERGENYAITPTSVEYQCIESTETIDYYEPPRGGTFYPNSQRMYYPASTNININLTSMDDWNEYPDASGDPLKRVYNMPGSTYVVRETDNGVLSVATSMTAVCCYASTINGPSMAGIIYTHDFVKKEYTNEVVFTPRRDTDKFFIVNNNTTDPYRLVHISRMLGGEQFKVMSPQGWFNYRNNTDVVRGYDENMTLLSDSYTSFATTIFDYREDDIEYYYPPEVDWKGEEYVASIASNANPTDAQKVVKIDPLEGSTSYLVHFADGHNTVYANTQAIYNKNLYYTTIQGIVTNYLELKHETVPVLYNVAVGEWKIGNDIVKVTRYTGVVTNNVATYFSYDDIELANPIQRTTSTDMIGVNEDGSTSTVPGYSSQTILRSDESYLVKQLDSAPEIYAVNGSSHPRNNVGVYNCCGGAISVGPNVYTYTGDYYEPSGSTIFDFKASRVTQTYGRRGEVAPANYTFRIWVRVDEDEYVDENNL